MYHGNDRLINLAVGAVVVIVFMLSGRLKRALKAVLSRHETLKKPEAGAGVGAG